MLALKIAILEAEYHTKARLTAQSSNPTVLTRSFDHSRTQKNKTDHARNMTMETVSHGPWSSPAMAAQPATLHSPGTLLEEYTQRRL